jgi:hypothetical protein
VNSISHPGILYSTPGVAARFSLPSWLLLGPYTNSTPHMQHHSPHVGHSSSASSCAISAIGLACLFVVSIFHVCRVVRTKSLPAAQRICVHVLRAAGHGALFARDYLPVTSHMVMVAKGAPTAQRVSILIARVPLHIRHWPLPCFFIPAQRTPVYLHGS